MHTTVRLDSLPEAARAEVLKRGIRRGVRVDIHVETLNRLIGHPQSPAKLSQWPLWAITLAAMKSDSDKGLGDTAEWVFGKFGGNAFKIATKKLGINCGCGERKEDWNRKYPYLLKTT